jgi:epoxide hydrolase-like predicted phosphatase
MIKAICFDLDGVFFTTESFKNFKKNLPKTVQDEDKINYVLYKSDEMFKFKTGKITEKEFWDYAKKELGISIDLGDVTSGLDNIYSVFRDSYNINNKVVDYVNKVKEAGYKTCVCSNNFPTRIKALDDEWGFLDCFDVKVFSYEVGYMKPAKEIFQVLIDKADVLPNKIVYSDDDESKMQGAAELGINTFLYTNFEDFIKHLENLGVKI